MTESIAAVQAAIIDEFALFDDWDERYRHLIDLGRALPAFPAQYRTPEYLVRGCQAQVWLHPRFEQGILYFAAASDALIVSGLIALLLRMYSGQEPAVILASRPDFVASIGLADHLSPTRRNGLHAMLLAIRAHAAAAGSG